MRKTTLSVISEIGSAFQNTFCFFQEPFHGREIQFLVTCKFWVHWAFFLEISIFWFRVWPPCQNDRAEHFFQVWKKIKLSLIFLCYGEARTSLIFFIKQNKIQLGPLEKWWRTKIFIVWETPIFLLEKQFYKISHYTVNKYQGSSNFWTVWPILEIQNAK